MEDLFDALESDEKPFKAQEQANKYERGNSKKQNLWDNLEIKPVKINVGEFKRTKKTFTVRLYNGTTAIPASIVEKVGEIAKIMAAKGYVYRHGSPADDVIQNDILLTPDIKVESFIPWKKFNPNITDPVKMGSDEKGYGIAVNSHKVFNKLPPAVRAILAKDVHVMLGADCNDPLDFMIVYTECGSETTSPKMDFKKLGPIAFLLKIAEDSNIPVFNFRNENAVEKLVALIKSKG